MYLLTTVVARLIDKKNTAGEYGVSVTNLPELDYADLFNQVNYFHIYSFPIQYQGY